LESESLLDPKVDSPDEIILFFGSTRAGKKIQKGQNDTKIDTTGVVIANLLHLLQATCHMNYHLVIQHSHGKCLI
jgi:hypothetical protein